uniref:hypothetical protein n=1 Tax=Neorhodopirellula lusitana TaxID=445327 RepID=UPI00384E17FF
MCQKVLQDAGLEHQIHASGRNIDGDWEAVFAGIELCPKARPRARRLPIHQQ